MAEIENLNISITASADEAAAKIRGLASSLRGVGKAGKEAAGDMKAVDAGFKTTAASSETGATHAKSFGDRLRGLVSHIHDAASSAKSGSGRINNFVASLKRIAYYRFIRTVLKEIAQGFKEGITNLYQWSSAVNGNFATSMNTIATATNYLKNSLGAVAAPLINSLAPAIDFVIDKFVALLNVINQFIAALTGASTYTAARKVSTEWGNATKSVGAGAKAAAKEIRTLLGFDEINKLDDASGGGGGGGGGGGSSGGAGALFEERPINSTIMKIADVFRTVFTPIFDFISENLNWILPTVGAIGAALLAWKIGNGLVSSIASINTSIGAIALALASLTAGVVISINTIELAKSEGLTWRVAGSWLAGSAAFGVAGMAIAKLLGAKILTGGLIGFNLGLAVVGTILTAELVKQDGLTWKSAATGGASIFGYGIAGAGIASLLAKKFPKLGITKLEGGMFGLGIGLGLVGTVTYAQLLGKNGLTWTTAGAGLASAFGFGIAGTALTSVLTKLPAFAGLGINKLEGGGIGFGVALGLIGTITSAKLSAKDGLTWKSAASGIAGALGFGITGASVASIVAKIAPSLGLSKLAGGAIGLGFGLIATGTINAITIANDTNETLNRKAAGIAYNSVIAGIGAGMTAVGMGATIAGGIAIGLTGGIALAAIATLVAIEARYNEAKVRASFGDLNATAEALRMLINSMLGVDVEVQATIIDTAITNADTAKISLDEAIANFESTLNTVTIGASIDETTDYQTLLTQFTGEDGVIAKLNTTLEEEQNKLRLLVSIVPPLNGEGNDMSADILTTLGLGNKLVEDALTDYGNRISELLLQGVNEGLDEKQATELAKLVKYWRELASMQMFSDIGIEFDTQVTLSLQSLTAESFLESLEVFQEQVKLLEQNARTAATQYLVRMQTDLVRYNKLAQQYLNEGEEIPEELQALISELETQIGEFDMEKTVQSAVGEHVDPARQQYLKAIKEIFGAPLSQVEEDVKKNFVDMFESAFDDSETWNVDYITDTVSGTIQRALSEIDPDDLGVYLSAQEVLGFNDWEMFTIETRQAIVDSLVDAVGASKTIQALNRLGYDLTGMIIDGMSPEDMKAGETIRKLGANMAKKIKDEIAEGKIQAPIEIVRKGWTTVTNWVNGNKGNTPVEAPVTVIKKGWTTISDWASKNFGNTPVDVSVTLKKTWSNAIEKLGLSALTAGVKITPSLTKNTIKLSTAGGGSQVKLEMTKALGGIFSAGRWRNLPQYANGTLNAGTIFAAGEAGPEVVGHIGGRTEVLNQSQLAATMFAAVRNAMTGVRIEGNITNDTADDEDMAALMEMVRAESDATVRQNDLLRQQNDYLRRIAEKEFSADISTAAINRAQNRMNRRAGMTVVPVDM